MKTALILLVCSLAGSVRLAGEQLPLPAKMEIAGAPDTQNALYESQLGEALRAVNAWWSEHGAGFRDYPMRMPRKAWTVLAPSFSSDPKLIGFAEDNVRANETQWFASTSKATPGSWKMSYPTGLKYSFEWVVDVSEAEPKIVEVRITSPVIGWIDTK